MAVVIHGSIDEGPIVLQVPPVFEGIIKDGIEVEVDPIFNAWDKSTGISIYKDQIIDRGDLATQADLLNYASQADLDDLLALTQAQGEELYVPYTGANNDVYLGDHKLYAASITINEEPANATDAATKGYVDSVVTYGIENGTPTIAHNDTTGKEGGGDGHYYHLSAATSAQVDIVTNMAADIVPTGLSIVSTGISTSPTGVTSAYVSLTWNAINSDTFNHYLVHYKKTSNQYWTPIAAYTNAITIDGLQPNVSYDFTVASINKYGTQSNFSGVVTTTMAADTTPPATVNVSSASAGIQCILLQWNHNTDTNLSSYNIYRNTSNDSASSTKVFNITGNRLTDAPLPASTTYYYWLKAVSTSGVESTNFSAEIHATTKAVTKEDITSISADKVLITGTTYLSNWTSTDSTKIDGAKIDTGTVSLSKLNFTPIVGGNVIATINSSEEGIQIDADNFAVSGATIFTKKTNGTLDSGSTNAARVRIFPDADTGIQITDDEANDVFKVIINGVNIGDLMIGNIAAGQGIYYDKSAHTTTFYGCVRATSGTIGGWGIDAEAIYTGSKKTSDGYSTSGITLAGNGSIHAKNFYINQDGTSSISGNLPHTVRKAASGVLRHAHNTEVSIAQPTYLGTGLAKTITFTNGLLGSASFSFGLKKHTYGGSDIGKARIYVNGSPLGTEQTAVGQDNYQYLAQTITHDWAPGDKCELRLYGTSGTTVSVCNFTVSYSDDPIVAVDVVYS